MSWRVVLGHHLTALPCDERGIWASPGGEIEALVFPRLAPGERYDPARHRVGDALRDAGWDGAEAYVQWTPEYQRIPVDAPYAVPRVCAAWGDWNLGGRVLRLLRPVLAASVVDLPGVAQLRRLGYEHVAPMLPWGWDPETGSWPVDAHRDLDVVFAGSRNPAIHGERERWLARVARMDGRHRVVITSGLSATDYHALLRRAKLVFNRSVRGEPNMRAFEAAAQGACVLNERGNASLAAIFGEDEGYAAYDDGDLEAVVARLLSDAPRRLAMARSGQAHALGNTYEGHLHETLGTLRELCSGGPAPTPPERQAWARLLLEQWRLSGRAPHSSVLSVVATISAVDGARHRALLVDDDPAGALAAAAEALAVGAHQDPAFLLAIAEAALAAGADGVLSAVQAARTATSAPTLVGVPTADFGDWRLALEQVVLDAPSDAAAALAAERWVRGRASWLLAAAAERSSPAEALALLDRDENAPIPLVFLRGRLRCAVGDVERGLADLRFVAAERPFDPSAAEALDAAERGARA